MIIGSISASLIISRLMRISSIMVLRLPRVSIIGARPVARLILLMLSLIFLMLSTSLVILLRLRYQRCLMNKSLMAGPSVQASYLIGGCGGASWHTSEHDSPTNHSWAPSRGQTWRVHSAVSHCISYLDHSCRIAFYHSTRPAVALNHKRSSMKI